MQHLSFVILFVLLKNGFSFPNYIWAGMIMFPVFGVIAYNLPWPTPFWALVSIVSLITMLLLVAYFQFGFAIFAGLGAALGLIAKAIFYKKKESTEE